jgi:hypothetical protein
LIAGFSKLELPGIIWNYHGNQRLTEEGKKVEAIKMQDAQDG